MPVADGRGGRNARGLYEPGGAFRHRPAVLTGVHDPELCETIEMRVRIAHRHDAVLTASSADPACLFIKSPLQSHRAAACDALLSMVVSSLCACPVTTYETMTPPTCPSIALDDRSRRPHHLLATSLRRPVQNEPVPISPMRRVRSEEFVCRARKPRARERFTHSVRHRARYSDSDFTQRERASASTWSRRSRSRQITTPIQSLAVIEMSQIGASGPHCQKCLRHRGFCKSRSPSLHYRSNCLARCLIF